MQMPSAYPCFCGLTSKGIPKGNAENGKYTNIVALALIEYPQSKVFTSGILCVLGFAYEHTCLEYYEFLA